jgi:hypothetical protein
VSVWIVGIDNPSSSDPADALSPSAPGNSAGGRLFEMSGMSLKDYLSAFKRGNVCDPLRFRKGDTVVVLGRVPWRRLSLPANVGWWLGARRSGVLYILVPHPSGRSLAYNDRINREALSSLLHRLAGET